LSQLSIAASMSRTTYPIWAIFPKVRLMSVLVD
jgi:hypothetical protein